MKVGVIGVGYWGKKHVEEYQALGHEVVVADLEDENLDYCEENYGTECFKDYNEILSDPEVFAVSICTPTPTHHKITMDAINSGKHTLIEKPMVTDIDEAEDIIDACKKNGVHVAVGYLFRYNNAVNYLKEQIEKGELGELYSLNFEWTNLEPVWPHRDIIFDLGAHPVDMSIHLLGQTPNNVHANGHGFRQENEEMALINYHVGDTMVNMEASWITPVKTREIMAIGSNKSVWIDALSQETKVIEHNNPSKGTSRFEERKVPITPSNTIREELRDFLDKSQNNPTHEEAVLGRDVIKILQAARHSVQHKRSTGLLNES